MSLLTGSLPLEIARALAVVKQGLHRRPATADKLALLKAIQQMGLLQLDTISVVARSHYLVLLSRLGLYAPADLDALLYPERALFEQWAHAMCLIPAEDYPRFAPVILARRQEPLHPHRVNRLGADPQGTLAMVTAEITARGPLSSKDFEDPRERRGSWWDWKPAKAALETLFTRGYLMVDRREKFQIYYDLAERVNPQAAELPLHTIEDWHYWAALRSVACLGVATPEQAADYYRQSTPTARLMLGKLAQAGLVTPVRVDSWAKEAYLATADLPLVEEISAGAHRSTVTTFLSPFDNLTWNRNRLLALFGFDYRVEMYTPSSARKYGYYVLPIFHRGRLVGRLDPKADRKAKTLIIRAMFLEPGEPVTDLLAADIAAALREFMVFHGSQTLRIEQSAPETLKEAVLAEYRRAGWG